VLILGTILGVGQLLAVFVSPELSTFLAVALLALYPLSRWRRFGEPIKDIPERPAMMERAMSEQREAAPVMSLSMSFLPYIVLTAVTLSVLLIPSLNRVLRQIRIGLPFPAVETGFGINNPGVSSYAPIAPFAHPGAMLLVTAVVMWLVYNAGGYYRAWGERHRPERIWPALLIDAVPASVPIIAFLVTSRILDHSGESLTLAYGLAAVSPPLIYAGVASVIGGLGGTWKALDQYLSDPKVLVVDSPEVVQKQAVALGQGAPAAIAILLLLVILLAFDVVPRRSRR
jgi:lactate permease